MRCFEQVVIRVNERLMKFGMKLQVKVVRYNSGDWGNLEERYFWKKRGYKFQLGGRGMAGQGQVDKEGEAGRK